MIIIMNAPRNSWEKGRKTITCLVMAIALHIHVLAQENLLLKDGLAEYYPKKFISHVDVFLGASMIYPRGDQLSNEQRTLKYGLAAGVGLNHIINERFEMSFNFLFENKGLKTSFTYSNEDFNPPVTEVAKLNYTFNYYTFVVLPTYRFKNKNISVGIGSYFSYLTNIRQQSEIYQDGNLIASSSSRPNADLFNRYDAGITLMGGYSFSIKKIKNFLHLRYNFGLIDFVKQPSTQSFYNSTITFYYGLVIVNEKLKF